MQTKKLTNKIHISHIIATIIDITDEIPASEKESTQLFNGLINYATAQLNINNYSIAVAKELAKLSGANIQTITRIYNSKSLTKHYADKGLAKLLIETKQYNIKYTDALKYQYEIDKLICNEYQQAKELENIQIFQEIEQILTI